MSCNPRSIQWELVQLGKLTSSQRIIITENLSVQKGKKKKERTNKSQYGILIQEKKTLQHNMGSCCTEIPILYTKRITACSFCQVLLLKNILC